jgi:truncated hemoglobin YjbI
MEGCLKLARAFYARVEHDPVLRPMFPSSFRCAIEGLAMFLAEFLGGPRDYTASRWSISLIDIHRRFKIGPREREHWLTRMSEAIDDMKIAEPGRDALRHVFASVSGYMIGEPQATLPPKTPFHEDLAKRWDAQRTLEDAASAVRRRDAARAIALAEGLERQPFLFLLGLMSGSGDPTMSEYLRAKLLADRELVRVRYTSGRTLLHEAAGNGNLAIVQLLLELGADPNAGYPFGHTPLYYAGNSCAAKTGSDIVRALFEAGANVNAHDGVKRCTPLHMAARRGYVPVATALLDCGAAIESRDRAGDTPLRRAVNCGKAEVAALLLSRGANLHSVGSRGLTPARAARGAAMQQLLRSHI